MITIFESENIKHPLIDFEDEALRMKMLKREKLENSMMSPNDTKAYIFQYLLDKRILLSYKLILLENFFNMYNRYTIEGSNILVNGTNIKISQFLWCMRLSSNSQGDGVSIESVIRTKVYLDEKENISKLCSCCGYLLGLAEEMHLDEINSEKEVEEKQDNIFNENESNEDANR